jgi:hypothetical protein
VSSVYQARSALGLAARDRPDQVPDARRDLAEAMLLARAREVVTRAIETGASPPSEELLPQLQAILGRWGDVQ